MLVCHTPRHTRPVHPHHRTRPCGRSPHRRPLPARADEATGAFAPCEDVVEVRFLIKKHTDSKNLPDHVRRLGQLYDERTRAYGAAHDRPLAFDAEEFAALADRGFHAYRKIATWDGAPGEGGRSDKWGKSRRLQAATGSPGRFERLTNLVPPTLPRDTQSTVARSALASVASGSPVACSSGGGSSRRS